MANKIEAHICSNGRVRPWPVILCSLCPTQRGVDVLMTQEEIDEFNQQRDKDAGVMVGKVG